MSFRSGDEVPGRKIFGRERNVSIAAWYQLTLNTVGQQDTFNYGVGFNLSYFSIGDAKKRRARFLPACSNRFWPGQRLALWDVPEWALLGAAAEESLSQRQRWPQVEIHTQRPWFWASPASVRFPRPAADVARETDRAGPPLRRARREVPLRLPGGQRQFWRCMTHGVRVLRPAIGAGLRPAQSPFASLILAFMTFGAGFLMRPRGLLSWACIRSPGASRGIFSRRADAVGTLSIAVMPDTPTRSLAPVLVVAGRLVQGISAGAELGGVSRYLAEDRDSRSPAGSTSAGSRPANRSP